MTHETEIRLRVPRSDAQEKLSKRIEEGQRILGLSPRQVDQQEWLRFIEAKTLWSDYNCELLKTLFTAPQIMLEYRNSTSTRGPLTDIKMKLIALRSILGRLELIPEEKEESMPREEADIRNLHRDIYSKCHRLYSEGTYAEAVEKSFKVVRDRLRKLTGHETGSEAFGKGHLHIRGAAAPHVDKDFNEGVRFLAMAIDRFRNEKSHTSDSNIASPLRAYEYLRLSSLAMHLLDNAEILSKDK